MNQKQRAQRTVVGQELRRKYRELGRSPSWAVHAKMHQKHAARAAKICAERAKSIIATTKEPEEMAAISVPIWQNFDNFFFNFKICQEFGDLLLHAYDFLEVYFPN